jgi:hypothetical protein
MMRNISTYNVTDLEHCGEKRTATDEELDAVARRGGYPYFYVTDFIKYQEKRGWKINGQPIRNKAAIFAAWAKARKARGYIDNELLNVP